MIANDITTSLRTSELEFSSKEALDALNELIGKRINKLKIEHWKAWEKDHSIDRAELNKEIEALKRQKEQLRLLLEKPGEKELRIKLEA